MKWTGEHRIGLAPVSIRTPGGGAGGTGQVLANATGTLAALNSMSRRIDRSMEPGRGDIALTLANVRERALLLGLRSQDAAATGADVASDADLRLIARLDRFEEVTGRGSRRSPRWCWTSPR